MFTPRELQLERGWPGLIEGDVVYQLAAQALQAFFTGGGNARRHAAFPLADVDLRPPVAQPPSVRDFYAFEQHVKTCRAHRGLVVFAGVRNAFEAGPHLWIVPWVMGGIGVLAGLAIAYVRDKTPA